jgi:hypothetical protein
MPFFTNINFITDLKILIFSKEKLRLKKSHTSADSITPENDTYIASAIIPFGFIFSIALFSFEK